MKESGSILAARVFVDVKQITGKSLNFFVTVLFIGEEWLSLFTLLNTGLSKQFCS